MGEDESGRAVDLWDIGATTGFALLVLWQMRRRDQHLKTSLKEEVFFRSHAARHGNPTLLGKGLRVMEV